MSQNNLLPIFLKLAYEPTLVVGGGSVAFQKIKQLLDAKSKIIVVSPKCNSDVSKLVKDGRIKLIQQNYDPRILERVVYWLLLVVDELHNYVLSCVAKHFY